MPEDTPGEEQPTMLSFAEAAERLVAEGIAQSMTAEGLRKLARDPASGWPIGPDEYRVVGKTRTLPYELLVPYMQGRRRGRGPDKTRQRNIPPKRQGDPAVTQQQTGTAVSMRYDSGAVGTGQGIAVDVGEPDVPHGAIGLRITDAVGPTQGARTYLSPMQARELAAALERAAGKTSDG